MKEHIILDGINVNSIQAHIKPLMPGYEIKVFVQIVYIPRSKSFGFLHQQPHFTFQELDLYSQAYKEDLRSSRGTRNCFLMDEDNNITYTSKAYVER